MTLARYLLFASALSLLSTSVSASTGCVNTCEVSWPSALVQLGNAYGAELKAGTTDNQPCSWITNNQTRVVIPAAGGLQIKNGAALQLFSADGSKSVALQPSASQSASTLPFTLMAAYGTTGQAVVALDNAGTLGFATVLTASTAALLGGNTLGATMTLGTLDLAMLDFIVRGNSVLRLTTTPSIQIRGNGTLATPLRFMDSTNAHRASIKAPDTLAADYTLTLPTTLCTAGQALTVADSAGAMGCASFASTASNVLQNGNTFAATMILATLDVYNLELRANNVSVLVVTPTPSVRLMGNGTVATPLRFLAADNAHRVDVKAPDTLAANVQWTWPNTQGTTGQLATLADNTGTITWVTKSLLQTAFAEVTTSKTMASTAVDASLISTSITIASTSSLLSLSFTASFSSSGNIGGQFSLLVDGVVKRGTCGHTHAAAGQTDASVALVYRVTGLSAASHTVEVRWIKQSGSGSGTLTLDPSTNVDQHASLEMREYTV